MVAERITPAAIAAELDVLDGDAKTLAGEVVVSIGFTNAAVKMLLPREWEELAAYLYALIAREPVKTSSAYAAHRIVLGALASELRGFAQAAGEPVGLQADLRAASTQDEERRIRARIADQQASLERHVDDALAAHVVQRELPSHTVIDPEPQEDPPADTPTETDDALDYL